ncbi:MAG: hypothetical protein HYY10_01470 [Candidatus Liptonbacteria bacterium]|nr:hypothetical protein [Candidatus Liptonbacteria bacterium]
MDEFELTYLAKEIPAGVFASPSKEITDIYIPASAEHPLIRIRKSGEKYEITKKQPAKEGDSSHLIESTISLAAEEYADLSKLPGKRVSKIRYYYPLNGTTYEFDVFQEGLIGLVLIDVEFKTTSEKQAFQKPAFCLADVTQEKFIAGGILAGKGILGKNYSEIEADLARFGYKKLS